MIALPIFDLPTRSSSGFMYRYILLRMAPPPLISLFARNPFFNFFIPFDDVVVGTGHGDPDSYYGQNESMIWRVGSYNPQQVKGKVIKLLSCNTGVVLGPDLVQNGARAFLGYDNDFLWLADDIYYPIPWADDIAAPCLMPVVQSLNALLDGASCAEALAIEKAGYLENINQTDFELLRSLLQFNYDHAVMYGDGSATVAPRPRIFPPIPPPPLLI